MKKLALLSAVFSVGVIACGGGGGDTTTPGGGGVSLTGVWKGTYNSTEGNGPMCVEMTDDNGNLSGEAWVAGYVWSGNFTGNLDGSNISGSIEGYNIENNTFSFSFNGTVGENTIEGSVSSDNITFSINLTKQDTDSCGYADLATVQAFAGAFGQFANETGEGNFTYLADFITELPTVEVEVDGNKSRWWVCVWEVRGNGTFTVGAAVNMNNTGEWTVWALPEIGLDVNNNPRAFVYDSLGLDGTNSTALYFNIQNGELFFANGTGDYYENHNGTTLVSQIYSDSCYEVYMTELTFSLYFDGEKYNATGSTGTNGTLFISNETIPALYVNVCP